jgi:hypothetical protein
MAKIRTPVGVIKKRGWAGHTIPQAARKLQMGESQIRRAVDRGEVNVVEFAGLKRITDSEIARIAELLGIEIADANEGRAA